MPERPGLHQFYDDDKNSLVSTAAHFFLPLLTPDLMTGSPDARAPNLHLLLTSVLPHTPRVLALFGETSLDKTVLWLDLLHGILAIIDETKACCVTTSKLRVEAEDDDDILVGLALGGNQILDLITGRRSSTRMCEIDNELLAVEQLVHDVLADTHCNFRHLPKGWTKPTQPLNPTENNSLDIWPHQHCKDFAKRVAKEITFLCKNTFSSC